jgi:hypothetical protein
MPEVLNSNNDTNKTKPTCGLVMPISAIESCSEEHWQEVKNILLESIKCIGFECKIVSQMIVE